jgi:hypothetical protein
MSQTTPTLAILLEYTVTIGSLTLPHTFRQRVVSDTLPTSITAGTDLANINLITRGDIASTGLVTALSAVQSLVTAWCDLYSGGMTVTNVQLRYYPNDLDGISQVLSIADLSNATNFPVVTGQQVGTPSAGFADEITFARTTPRAGKAVCVERNLASNEQRGLGDLTAEELAFVDLFTGSNAVFRSTSDTFYVQMLRWNNSQNETVYRKRFRA